MIKRKIRKDATKKMLEIFNSAKKIKYHTHHNDYRGEYGELLQHKNIRWTIEDIQEGRAHLYLLDDGRYMVAYAGRCRWYIEV